MNFSFGEVLARAWQIAWKHKGLWWAGILVSLLGLVSVPINLVTNPVFSSGYSSHIRANMAPILIGDGLIFLVSILTIPITALAMLVPSLATVRLERGEENVHFGELVKGVWPYFWRALAIFLLVWVGAFAGIILLMGCLLLLAVLTAGIGFLCVLPLMLVLIPVTILVYAMMEQALSAILVDDIGIGVALQRAWELVKRNILVMVILSILIYLAYTIIGMIISIPIMIPFLGMFSRMIFNTSTQQPPDFEAFGNTFRNMMLWMLAFSPLYAVLQGFLLAFMQSVWTLTYLRLSRLAADHPVVIEANA
jgi:hypothetical protein